LECLVANEGKISNRKGVNTPDSVLDISPLTPKDRSDLEYMLGIGVDWVALSFVQRKEDIEEMHQLIDKWLPEGSFKPAVMAKIEKPSCFIGNSLEEIVELCDGIMVARGDLGVECAPEDVPLLQKEIIDECRKQGKPVVVATQMLESMIDSPTPTRAEASDVATAIYDGADAIMLSAESAAGKVSFVLYFICSTHFSIRLHAMANAGLLFFSSNSTPKNPWQCSKESSIVSRVTNITEICCLEINLVQIILPLMLLSLRPSKFLIQSEQKPLFAFP